MSVDILIFKLDIVKETVKKLNINKEPLFKLDVCCEPINKLNITKEVIKIVES